MRLLVDTNVLLWALTDDPKLSARAARVLSDPANTLFVSAISLAEMHVKRRIGKLKIPKDIESELVALGFQWLPLLQTHAPWLSELPLHHRDPFDRMLIAQAIEEGMSIVTSDDEFDHYPVSVIRN